MKLLGRDIPVVAAKWVFRKTCQVLMYAQPSAEVLRLRREVEELKAAKARKPAAPPPEPPVVPVRPRRPLAR
jgi:hypothetical protein